MFSFFHCFGGYCQVILSGINQERFLNLCVMRNILLWNIKRKENHISFYISKRGYGELEEIAQKTGCIFRCEKQKGFPFFWKRYRKRKIFALTILLFFLMLLGMSQFIWQIQCIESGVCSEEEMMKYLKKEKIVCGIAKSKISCEKLEEQIRKDFPDIVWVSCAMKGTVLQIQWKESLPIEEKAQNKSKPCDLIAQKNGKISSIVVRNGQAMVQPGDMVKKGDVLISGTVSILDDGGEVMEQLEVPADGDIYATTTYKYEDEVPFLQYEKEYTGRRKTYVEGLFGTYRFLEEDKTKSIEYSHYDLVTEPHFFHIGEKWYFPIAFYVTTAKEYDIKKKCLTEKEARQQLEKHLSLFFQESEREGLTFLKNNVTIKKKEEKCIASGTLLVKERFGKIQNK